MSILSQSVLKWRLTQGSKPGAAAVSAWLSNKTIGLNPQVSNTNAHSQYNSLQLDADHMGIVGLRSSFVGGHLDLYACTYLPNHDIMFKMVDFVPLSALGRMGCHDKSNKPFHLRAIQRTPLGASQRINSSENRS